MSPRNSDSAVDIMVVAGPKRSKAVDACHVNAVATAVPRESTSALVRTVPVCTKSRTAKVSRTHWSSRPVPSPSTSHDPALNAQKTPSSISTLCFGISLESAGYTTIRARPVTGERLPAARTAAVAGLTCSY